MYLPIVWHHIIHQIFITSILMSSLPLTYNVSPMYFLCIYLRIFLIHSFLKHICSVAPESANYVSSSFSGTFFILNNSPESECLIFLFLFLFFWAKNNPFLLCLRAFFNAQSLIQYFIKMTYIISFYIYIRTRRITRNQI